MKKIICLVLCAAMAVSCVVMCSAEAHAFSNFQFFDTTYNFNYAQIAMPDGSVVEGNVDSWLDFEASDMIQVKIDGDTYLTHSMNVVLVSK